MHQPASVCGPYLGLDLNKWNVETKQRTETSITFDIYERIWNPNTDQIFDMEEWLLIFESLSMKLCGYVRKDLFIVHILNFCKWDVQDLRFTSEFLLCYRGVSGNIDETRLVWSDN